MRVGILWMAIVWLSDGEVTTCSVERIITVPKPSKVTITCPPSMGDIFNYHLSFNASNISEIQVNKPDLAGSLFYGQFEVTANDSGFYSCKMEVIYPPPHREYCHTTEVKVDSKMSDLHYTEISVTDPAANQSCPDRSPFIPEVVLWVGCGVLFVYSLTVTCISIAIWKLKRHDEDTNVYANTRPVENRKPCKV
ncbi:uncharacterized protein LOC121194942 isoform X2 [Toxotes jaculatrix]|uniref:uncharacterized protein LOC121194942 isoform X2 n=1 Tax=Toxotes jaculatrix TaxID=941984 RepID=UPI001B3A9659|nr:uncharacterized protein LOC121194942 isoform X2 [Toxotes jaculatrix]